MHHSRLHRMVREKPAFVVAGLSFLLALLVSSGDFGTIDTACRLQVTHWIWNGEPQIDAVDPDLRDCPAVPGRGGQVFAAYGIGQSIAMLPADLAAHALLPVLRFGPEIRAKAHGLLVAVGTFPALIALAAFYAFRLLRELAIPSRTALATIFLLTTCTSFLVYAQICQENSLVFMLVCASLYHAARARTDQSLRHAWLAGAFVGASVLAKITNLAFAVPAFALLVAAVLERHRSRKYRLTLAPSLAFFSSVGAAVFLDRLYHWYRFGNAWGTYAYLMEGDIYVHYPAGGILGPLVSPDKSIFLFDPLLLAAALLVPMVWNRIGKLERTLLLGLSASFLLILGVFSLTSSWDGNSAWGPRHHLVAVELLLLPAIGAVLRYAPSYSASTKSLLVATVLTAGVVQVSALPKSYNLEVEQVAVGSDGRIVPLLRLQNLYAVGAGRFEAGNLHLGQKGILEIATRETANTLFPFRIGPYVGRPVQAGIVVTWCAALAAFLMFWAEILRSKPEPAS
jgi:hypothetical protein